MFLRNAAARFRDMRIASKMLIGYLVLVMVPTIAFGALFYHQFYSNIFKDYSESQQHLVQLASNSFEVSLAQAESIYNLFQYNPEVTDHLGGHYTSDADQVYNYLKNIRPVINFALSGNSFIRSVQLYVRNKQVLPVQGELGYESDLTNPRVVDTLKTLSVNRGVWMAESKAADQAPTMTYYQKIYDPTFSFELGVLKVEVRPDIMTDFFNSVAPEPNRNIVFYQDGQALYRSLNIDLPRQQMDAILARLQSGDDHFYWQEHKLFINSIAIKGLPFRIMLINGVDGAFSHVRERTIGFAGVLVGLLALLSLVYYLIVSTITKRIVRLAKHMRKVDQDHLPEYVGRVDKDEIGLLTASYNLMIRRIDDLLNRVHRAELMKKEADYQVLQAQIKPHFLYNTLESIRMLAEINDDEEVVEAIYTFGRLLRYSLSSGENDTPLAEEIENVRHYLQVHKIRMEDKLKFDFRIETDLSDIRCPRFILQPLVENCIVHGLGKSRKGGRIDVHVCREDDRIRISIADDGGGVPPERLETIRGVLDKRLNKNRLQTTGSGMGLYNVSERIKAYFGPGSELRIDSGPDEGTRYTIIFRPGRDSDAESDDRR
ncbi:sensor histidine kinase [Cohnella zeiphila]|uniref:histidine kinase n=1 Tax=Cohnella zeiphila TaxID=2761120 RepID=A0A7X0SLR6_9BACL|nr:sensor histidine kinase [Cohnella zeiphila]MBB6731025.1 sensor histidine kinase [Cohnella zeiphila]